MKNKIHDRDRWRATSIAKNISYSEDLVRNNGFFNKKMIAIPETNYLEADQISQGQIEENYNADVHAIKNMKEMPKKIEEKFSYREYLPEKYHESYR
jgi:hypothetical protein